MPSPNRQLDRLPHKMLCPAPYPPQTYTHFAFLPIGFNPVYAFIVGLEQLAYFEERGRGLSWATTKSVQGERYLLFGVYLQLANLAIMLFLGPLRFRPG